MGGAGGVVGLLLGHWSTLRSCKMKHTIRSSLILYLFIPYFVMHVTSCHKL